MTTVQERTKMKKLLITLMLISPFSFADWGDVYYCQMTYVSKTNLEAETTNYELGQKFQFKLDETKKSMVFGSSGYFADIVAWLDENQSWPSVEAWYAIRTATSIYFEKGKFASVRLDQAGATTVIANCDKF